MYGKVLYDSNADIFTCEFPIRDSNGGMRICGRACRDLVRHITRHHKVPVRKYKELLGLDLNEPLMSRKTTEILARKAIENETYKNLSKGKPYRLRKGESRVQGYARSEQSKSRLRVLKTRTPKKRVVFKQVIGYNKINKGIEKENI